MVCTGTTLFVVVKGQTLIIPHSFKMESNEPGKVRKLIIRVDIQRDSKRLTQFRTSIFPELYMVYE